jgi:hypothetical protein
MNQLTHLLLFLKIETPGITEVALHTNVEGRWAVSYKEGLVLTHANDWFATPDDAIGRLESTIRENATKRRVELERKLKTANEVLMCPPLVVRD